MAGNIQSMSFSKLSSRLHDYIVKVLKIKESLLDVHHSISTLRTYWTGKRMNAVIDTYNSVNKALLNNYFFFGRTVLNALAEIHAQYAQMEQNGVAVNLNNSDSVNVGIEEIEKLIETTSIENVKFEQEQVISSINKIDSDFENLTNDLSTIIGILDDLKTDSDSLNKLVTNYNAASASIVSNIMQIKETIKTELDNAVKVVQTTEAYNDSDASRVQGGTTAE